MIDILAKMMSIMSAVLLNESKGPVFYWETTMCCMSNDVDDVQQSTHVVNNCVGEAIYFDEMRQ